MQFLQSVYCIYDNSFYNFLLELVFILFITVGFLFKNNVSCVKFKLNKKIGEIKQINIKNQTYYFYNDIKYILINLMGAK